MVAYLFCLSVYELYGSNPNSNIIHLQEHAYNAIVMQRTRSTVHIEKKRAVRFHVRVTVVYTGLDTDPLDITL